MDKNDVIEYVMNTPHNTNRAVLNSMLNQLAEGGGGGGSAPVINVVNDGDYPRLDKTFSELKELIDGRIIMLLVSPQNDGANGYRVVTDVSWEITEDQDRTNYRIYLGGNSWDCSSVDDYPKAYD